jgi:ribosomal protein S7
MSVNQTINAAIADGMIASIALCGSLPFVISGKTTKAKNVMNSALRIILERKGEAINTAVFVLKAFVNSSIH